MFTFNHFCLLFREIRVTFAWATFKFTALHKLVFHTLSTSTLVNPKLFITQ